MLRVLIIDDSADKIRNIEEVITSSAAYPAPEITRAGDLYSGRREMREVRFDLVILDINIPIRAGEDPSPQGCESFLIDVGRNKSIKKPKSLLGITAFDKLFDKCNSVFAAHGWLLFNFELDKSTWPMVIIDQLRFMSDQLTEYEAKRFDYESDIAIITALATPELAEVLAWPVNWQLIKAPDDFVEYRQANMIVAGRSIRIIAASCQHMGMVAASTLTLKTCKLFKPRTVVMVGIAAGVRGRTNIGDILISEESWDYNSGKLGKSDSQRTFSPDPKSIRITPELCELFQDPVRNASYVLQAFESWKGPLPQERPKLLMGPVASGSSVIADAEKVREISEHNRKLIGLEMETYGVYFASLNAWTPKPDYLSIKAVCDFADENKTDGFQAYAAHMSARLLFVLLQNGHLGSGS